jgi:hypothetical protein
MKSKSQLIRDALATGDYTRALRIAAHLHDRSANTLTYKRGFDAHNHPDFYRQIGRDPERLTATALELLKTNFNSHRSSHAIEPSSAVEAKSSSVY